MLRISPKGKYLHVRKDKRSSHSKITFKNRYLEVGKWFSQRSDHIRTAVITGFQPKPSHVRI